jgi:hypothetical protein
VFLSSPASDLASSSFLVERPDAGFRDGVGHVDQPIDFSFEGDKLRIAIFRRLCRKEGHTRECCVVPNIAFMKALRAHAILLSIHNADAEATIAIAKAAFGAPVRGRSDTVIGRSNAECQTTACALLSIGCALLPLDSWAVTTTVDKTTRSGFPIQIALVFVPNPDCTANWNFNLKTTEEPKYGTLKLSRGDIWPRLPASNPNHGRSGKRIQGLRVIYQSNKGYVGPDNVSLDVIFPHGSEWIDDISVTVK